MVTISLMVTRSGHRMDSRQLWMGLPGCSLGVFRRMLRPGSRADLRALSCLSEVRCDLKLAS